MRFMQKEVTEKQGWFQLDGPNGLLFLPADMFTTDEAREQYPGFTSLQFGEGYGARLSAPGYLDCTEWAVFETEVQAYTYINNLYVDFGYE